MIDAIIIEDELKSRGILKGLLKKSCPDVMLVGEADSVEKGLELIKRSSPSLVFLDIELGDGNAFDLLTKLPEVLFHIIITTAHDHYAMRAIKFSAIDYLLKPINSLDLKIAVEKVKSKGENNMFKSVKMLMANFLPPDEKHTEKIALPTFDGHIFINLIDIIRFGAEGNYTIVFMTDGSKIMVSKTLKEFEDFVNNNDFVRIHRSNIINLKHLKRYKKGRGGFVIMDDGSELEVSMRKKEELLYKMHIN